MIFNWPFLETEGTDGETSFCKFCFFALFLVLCLKRFNLNDESGVLSILWLIMYNHARTSQQRSPSCITTSLSWSSTANFAAPALNAPCESSYSRRQQLVFSLTHLWTVSICLRVIHLPSIWTRLTAPLYRWCSFCVFVLLVLLLGHTATQQSLWPYFWLPTPNSLSKLQLSMSSLSF